jgi:hypothetical protein
MVDATIDAMPDAGPVACTGRCEVVDTPVVANVDLLFVIDNSGSMGEEQASLATSFNAFISVLESLESGLPSLHLGVVSSNVGAGGQPISACIGDGDNGRLQNSPRTPICSPPSGYFISDVVDPSGDRIQNYTGSLAESFACIARLGVNGCGFEQHMEAMRRALDGRNPENAGFLRTDAHLVVVFLADEDDCSATSGAVFDPSQNSISDPLGPRTSFRCAEFGILCDGSPIGRAPASLDPPGEPLECEPQGETDPAALAPAYLWHPRVYANFLKRLKPDHPTYVTVAAIVGDADPVAIRLDEDGNPDLAPSCLSGAGEADPGVRFHWLLDQFPNRSVLRSICDTDLSGALGDVAHQIARATSPCLEGAVDLTDADPAVPGLQLDCDVVEADAAGETPLERCPMLDVETPDPAGPRPCWFVAAAPVACAGTVTGLALRVARAAAPAAGTILRAECLVPP